MGDRQREHDGQGEVVLPPGGNRDLRPKVRPENAGESMDQTESHTFVNRPINLFAQVLEAGNQAGFPQLTAACFCLLFHNLCVLQGGLFQSPHTDENSVHTISHGCEVLPIKEYTRIISAEQKKKSGSMYYLAGSYDPAGLTVHFQPGVLQSNSDSE